MVKISSISSQSHHHIHSQKSKHTENSYSQQQSINKKIKKHIIRPFIYAHQFLKFQISQKIALHKSSFHQNEQKILFIQLQLGPSLEQLLQIGITFTTSQIFSIALRLARTLKFLQNQNKIFGGIFPSHIYFSKNLETFYLIGLQRVTQFDKNYEVIRHYDFFPNQLYLKSAFLYGAENLTDNIIPSWRDEIETLLNLIYYLICSANKTKFVKYQISKCQQLKQLHECVKSMKFQDVIRLEPFIGYFSRHAKPIKLNSDMIKNVNIQKIQTFRKQNPGRARCFDEIIKYMSFSFDQNIKFLNQSSTRQSLQFVEESQPEVILVNY